MAELFPAIHVFLVGSRVQIFIQVAPAGIGGVDEAHFQGARRVFDIALALDRVPDVFVELGQHQALEAIPEGEAVDRALATLERAARYVAGHARVERAVRPVRHDVEPTAAHRSEG